MLVTGPKDSGDLQLSMGGDSILSHTADSGVATYSAPHKGEPGEKLQNPSLSPHQ